MSKECDEREHELGGGWSVGLGERRRLVAPEEGGLVASLRCIQRRDGGGGGKQG